MQSSSFPISSAKKKGTNLVKHDFGIYGKRKNLSLLSKKEEEEEFKPADEPLVYL